MKSLIIKVLTLSLMAFTVAIGQNSLKGAWQKKLDDGVSVSLICSDGYLMMTHYKEKQFLYTEGGTYKVENARLVYGCEFNSRDSLRVGGTFTVALKVGKSSANLSEWGEWQRIDDGSTPATATYRITGRMSNDGKITTMQRGARKTLKMLTGTRFQWAAINPETKQFMGTGGGTYSIKDGKYTETIEFFSRDNSRVGASLTFDYDLKDGKDWHHSGLSSAGAKIYEVWSKEI